ncbi:hypothetical protein BB559_003169 [Furculomyces boomerangus]|uniref:FFD box profile domain-containing protein n=2 Tax=Harpellales TaxID=61421 RepID=A0A2T9YN75_9FUNG|nr:hypothetical protein BB559_003169 [Furculomyces boomerangus]PVZ99862.1 hypothetical protein BB558_004112 [Smittium angustum]
MSENSHFGNRISLISKSGFRYIGILKDVNENEQTISLVQVQSMGTEGRKQDPKDEVPPFSEIYEFVQFRATDVISVQFETDAPPPPQPHLPQDPAILGSGQSQPPTKPEPKDVPIQEKQPTKEARRASQTIGSEKDSEKTTEKQLPQKVIPEPITASKEAPQNPPQQQITTNNTNTRGAYRGTRGRGAGRGRGSDVREMTLLNVSESVESVKSPEESVIEQEVKDLLKKPDDYYNKKKSFFDDISCEIKERTSNQHQGMSYKERRERVNDERRHNVETFGMPTPTTHHRYHHAGGYRGRGQNPNYTQNSNRGYRSRAPQRNQNSSNTKNTNDRDNTNTLTTNVAAQ